MINNIMGVIVSSLGTSVLLIGKVTPDDKLGMPGLNTYVFLLVFLIAIILDKGKPLIKVFTYLSPLLTILVPLSYSDNFDYGLHKASGLIISSLLAATCYFYVLKNFGVDFLLKNVLIMLSCLLVLAIIYKLNYGFWIREVNFFLNGPINFSRLMGMALLISIYRFAGFRRIAVILIFLFAMIWTNSKGPLFAIFIVLLYMYCNSTKKLKYIPEILVGTFVSLIVCLILWQSIDISNLRSFDRYFADITTSSYSERLEVIKGSVRAIVDQPILGAGLGDWALVVPNKYGIAFPHNIFLEVFVEFGLILGFIFLIPSFYFIFNRNNIFFTLALFFLITHQVGGDIVNQRYVVVFSVLSLLVNKRSFLHPKMRKTTSTN